MKKLFCLLLAALLLCTLAACGREDTEKKPAAEDAEGTAAVDIDLTALSGIMVYSEVNSMISFPDNYIGKTVKMQGQFTIYQATDENGAFIPDKMFFACMIADATACCAQGLEFALAGKPVYPFYGSDADAALDAGYDLRHGLIGAGVYASHGYERSHIDGVKNTYELVKAYITE